MISNIVIFFVSVLLVLNQGQVMQKMTDSVIERPNVDPLIERPNVDPLIERPNVNRMNAPQSIGQIDSIMQA